MAEVHAVSGDPLAGLQELPLPQPVAFVPQTIGWLVVAIVLALLIAYAAWRIVKYRRANAYRRQALAELARIEAALDTYVAPSRADRPQRGDAAARPSPVAAPGEVEWASLPALLKRTAIAATSREQVASLSGDEWLRFLDRTLNSNAFVTGPGRLLPRLAYSQSLPAEISTQDLDQLVALSRRWIKHHYVRHADL